MSDSNFVAKAKSVAASIPWAAATAIVALGVAIGAWFFPRAEVVGNVARSSDESTAYLCGESKRVLEAVAVNTRLTVPPGDLGASLGIVANARTILLAGGSYMRHIAEVTSDASSDLRNAVAHTGDAMMTLGIGYFHGEDRNKETIDELRTNFDDSRKHINDICNKDAAE
ncbi:MAG: hypothetical protein E6R04_06840 [Spirochaetes bacterium]|nr:MAG: hypothetical protein E6R04_06840 [Spirochaetota bacterium]